MDQVTNLVDDAIETDQTTKDVPEEIPIQETVAVQDPDHNVIHETVRELEVETLKEIPIPDPWNPYYAGDRVEAIRLQVNILFLNSSLKLKHSKSCGILL